jgi:seryl-tRNA synthetase
MMFNVHACKKDLEKKMRNEEEVEVSKRSKRPLQESDVNDADSVSLAKKRKELNDAPTAAAIATANEMAKQISHERNASAINSSEIQKQQHLREIKKLTDKVKELSEKLEDKQSSVEAKRVVISNLEDKVKRLENENLTLRCDLDRSKCNTNTTGKYIIMHHDNDGID